MAMQQISLYTVIHGYHCNQMRIINYLELNQKFIRDKMFIWDLKSIILELVVTKVGDMVFQEWTIGLQHGNICFFNLGFNERNDEAKMMTTDIVICWEVIFFLYLRQQIWLWKFGSTWIDLNWNLRCSKDWILRHLQSIRVYNIR